jgi:two-component system sensor kinase FixL
MQVSECSNSAMELPDEPLAERAAVLELVRDVAVAANEANTFDEALDRALARVCIHNGWAYGHAFLVTGPDGDELTPCEVDFREQPNRFERFRAFTLAAPLRKGQGLPGRVLASGKPEWTSKLQQELATRGLELNEDLGVSMALAFPTLAGDQVAAVVEVFSDDASGPLEKVVETTGVIGSLLGRVAQRSQAARSAYESTERLRAILDTAADGILTIDPSGRIQSLNAAAEQIFGYSAEEVVGKNVEMLMPSPADHGLGGYLERFSETGADDALDRRTEVVGHRKGGTAFPMDLAVSQIGHLGLFVCIVRDLTARKQAERESKRRQEELGHVARVAMMGELAAGLAHELNQPLCALVTSAQAAKRLLESKRLDREKIRNAMDEIASSGKRAGELIERLRKFLRKESQDHSRLHVNEVVRAMAELARIDALEHDAAIRFDLADGLPQVLGDPIQLQQVLVNLVHNGLQAMLDHEPDSRELTIRTALGEKGAVEVSVRDTGVGLAKDTAHHLFKPFFTTKAAGMGMGLAIARSIIDAHGGRIWATANSGSLDAGTTFQFALPPAEEVAEP